MECTCPCQPPALLFSTHSAAAASSDISARQGQLRGEPGLAQRSSQCMRQHTGVHVSQAVDAGPGKRHLRHPGRTEPCEECPALRILRLPTPRDIQRCRPTADLHHMTDGFAHNRDHCSRLSWRRACLGNRAAEEGVQALLASSKAMGAAKLQHPSHPCGDDFLPEASSHARPNNAAEHAGSWHHPRKEPAATAHV